MMPPSSSSVTAVAAVGGAGEGGEAKICINTCCKETIKSDGVSTRKKGWRLRSGEDADLCDRCFTSYEEGSFCETFHSENDGWRKCETCQKRVHCGCIVAVASFVLLDGGGIECATCAQKCCGLPVSGPNQMWSSSLYVSPESERPKEPPGKNWNQLTTSSQVPGQWRPAPNAWSSAIAARSELHQRLSFEFDRPNSIEKLLSTGRSFVSEKRKVDDLHERQVSTGLNRITMDRSSNGNSVVKSPGFTAFHREDGSLDRLQESSILMVDSDPIATRKGIVHGSRFSSTSGVKIEKVPPHVSTLKEDQTTHLASLPSPFSPSSDANSQVIVTTNQTPGQNSSSPMAKQFYHNSNHNSGIDSPNETQTQMRNGRPRVDARGRNQLLSRYWPRITDQELQQISGDSNSIIIPLFEKILSASDAGRIGRLVLPKKCAEAYFPAISQPEGLPLKVKDATGKDWVFQFRFWPNNNSRMYVLEGVTPCIQSMQLQAGDTVTFSRIDPEGKLVMGFRKASNTQNEQQTSKLGNGLSSSMSETSNIKIKHGDLILGVPSCPVKAGVEFTLTNTADRTRFKNDNSEFIQKERPISKSSVPLGKRKSGMVASKRKRLRIENEDSLELKLTWEEAQELLRPPPNHPPSIMVIEGHEFEEYEEAPVLGKPTIFITNQDGEKVQWVQCEDCSKWRKLPIDAALPPRWTCADNFSEPEKSSCLSTQEISKELEDVLPFNNANSRKSKAKDENDTVSGSDGLDTLANLAILVEGESPSQPTTTKHPRHRPGCTCIVCIQPPSGKGPKHKQSCCCNVCLTVKRRFRTLLLRKEKRQSEKEAETARRKQKLAQSPEASLQQIGDKPAVCKPTNIHQTRKTPMGIDEVTDDDTDRRKELLSVVKTEIDLNIQPEREEEISPVSDIYNAKRLSSQNPTS